MAAPLGYVMSSKNTPQYSAYLLEVRFLAADIAAVAVVMTNQVGSLLTKTLFHLHSIKIAQHISASLSISIA